MIDRKVNFINKSSCKYNKGLSPDVFHQKAQDMVNNKNKNTEDKTVKKVELVPTIFNAAISNIIPKSDQEQVILAKRKQIYENSDDEIAF
jgi:hypothetical protein